MNGDVLTALDYGRPDGRPPRRRATCSRSPRTAAWCAPSTASCTSTSRERQHAERLRLRGEAGDPVRGQHGRLRPRAARARLHRAGRSTSTCPTSCSGCSAEGAPGRLLPLRRLLARHRAPRGLREGADRVRAAAADVPAGARAPDRDRTSEGARHRRRRLRRRRAGRRAARRRATRCARSTCCCTARRTSPRASRRAASSCSAATCATPTPAGARCEGVDAVVHLAAIVGDPACGARPRAVQRRQRRGQPRAGRRRPRGRRRAPRVRLHLLQLRPHGRPDRADRRDRRAAPRVALRRAEGRHRAGRCSRATQNGLAATCLRFATVYGVGHRMRFDLTVNEFTRDLWAERKLDVFGEPFWRPYVHVRDAARAVALVLASPLEKVAGARLQRRPLGRELPQARPGRDHHRAPRAAATWSTSAATRTRATTRSRSSRSRASSASSRCTGCPTGIDEIVGALEEKRFGDPFSPRYSNIG